MKRKLKTLVKQIIGPFLYSAHWYIKEAIYFTGRRRLMGNLGHCEADLSIAPPWDIRGENFITIGHDVYIGPSVVMLAGPGAEIHIGDKVMFGPQVKLIANDHRFDDPTLPIKHSGYGDITGVYIGNDVWIGAAAIILKGVRIADGAIIGAGSVVTADVGSCEVWAGNPARKLRDRFAVRRSS